MLGSDILHWKHFTLGKNFLLITVYGFVHMALRIKFASFLNDHS